MKATLTTALALCIALAAANAPAQDTAAKKPLPPGCKEWKDTDFVHPPLEVMEPYKRIDEYPVVAWCFHGRGKKHVPYDETYARNAKKIGFNMLIDAAAMLEPCRKVGGIKVVVPVFHHDPKRLNDYIFKPHGDHPMLVALIVDDNNPRIHKNVIQNAKWITENYPHIIPWDSENPDPKTQSRTTMRVLGTQNYPFMRGYKNPVGRYNLNCWIDRIWGLRANMSVWEIFSGANSYNQIRFQMYASLAYGAQGIVNFAYTPHRDTPHRGKMYQPDSPLVPLFKRDHDYIRLVVGRHLWGNRCINVIHSIHGGDHSHGGWKIEAPKFQDGQLVVRGNEFMMVGLLTPEKRFRAKDTEIPEYFLVIDKRTSGGSTPKRQKTGVMLALKVPVVEMLDETAVKGAKIRKIIPGWKVRMETEGGQALLLRVAPDLEKLLGGSEGMAIYEQINTTMAALQWKATPPSPKDKKIAEGELPHVVVDKKEIDKTVKAAEEKVAELAKVLAAAVKAGDISKEQAADTIQRLKDAIAATATEAATEFKEDE